MARTCRWPGCLRPFRDGPRAGCIGVCPPTVRAGAALRAYSSRWRRCSPSSPCSRSGSTGSCSTRTTGPRPAASCSTIPRSATRPATYLTDELFSQRRRAGRDRRGAAGPVQAAGPARDRVAARARRRARREGAPATEGAAAVGGREPACPRVDAEDPRGRRADRVDPGRRGGARPARAAGRRSQASTGLGERVAAALPEDAGQPEDPRLRAARDRAGRGQAARRAADRADRALAHLLLRGAAGLARAGGGSACARTGSASCSPASARSRPARSRATSWSPRWRRRRRSSPRCAACGTSTSRCSSRPRPPRSSTGRS